MTGAVVTISGNLTADPELRYTQNGIPVASFTVAHTQRRFNRETNEWEDYGDTLFLECSAWRELGENVAASLRKGNQVFVEGRLEQRNWETKDTPPQKRKSVECRAEVVAIDLRRQTVSSVMRIVKGGGVAPDEPWETSGTPAAPAAPASRRGAAAA